MTDPYQVLVLLALLVMVGFCGRDALRDRTPRRPEWEPWRNKPALVWWARQRTRGEHRRHRQQLLPRVGARRR
jgi:hypothetical protein